MTKRGPATAPRLYAKLSIIGLNGHWGSEPTRSAVRCILAFGLRFVLNGWLPYRRIHLIAPDRLFAFLEVDSG
jgi:hypothetical protein